MVLPSKLDRDKLRIVFDTAGGGRDAVSFDEAMRLEGIDGVLEEGAASLKELLLLWGDESRPLGFDDFCRWYSEVLTLYDEFLWKDAVAPPDDLLADVGEEDQKEYTDDELLEDAPARGQVISELAARTTRAAGVATPGRDNIQVTRLFRQGCSDDNMLSFEGLTEISEIAELVRGGELAEDELRSMWARLPAKDGRIDVIAFRDLLARIDDLFEYVEDGDGKADRATADGTRVSTGARVDAAAGVGGASASTGASSAPAIGRSEAPPGSPSAKAKSVTAVKRELLAVIDSLGENEARPCGLDGREETDAGIVNLTSEIEGLWRASLGDIDEFDSSTICGDWALVYSTSAKFRRWGTILNSGNAVPRGEFDALLQSFAVADDGSLQNQYDMEEVFAADGKELAMRGIGSWGMSLQQNVVTGLEDVVLRLQVQTIEYDTQDGKVQQAEKKLVKCQMCRTFCYSFLAFLDDDLLVIRTGLSSNSVFIYQRLKADSEDAGRPR